jgi:EpsI family protein
MLSVAYGTEQSAALQLHRPEICYGSDGFEVTQLHAASLDLQPGTLPVTRLHASMLGRSEPITYWTLLGDTVVGDTGAFWARRWASSLRGEVLDGMLVRVSSIDPDPASAYRLHASFVRQLWRSMAPRWRERVFGVASMTAGAGS